MGKRLYAVYEKESYPHQAGYGSFTSTEDSDIDVAMSLKPKVAWLWWPFHY